MGNNLEKNLARGNGISSLKGLAAKGLAAMGLAAKGLAAKGFAGKSVSGKGPAAKTRTSQARAAIFGKDVLSVKMDRKDGAGKPAQKAVTENRSKTAASVINPDDLAAMIETRLGSIESMLVQNERQLKDIDGRTSSIPALQLQVRQALEAVLDVKGHRYTAVERVEEKHVEKRFSVREFYEKCRMPVPEGRRLSGIGSAVSKNARNQGFDYDAQEHRTEAGRMTHPRSVMAAVVQSHCEKQLATEDFADKHRKITYPAYAYGITASLPKNSLAKNSLAKTSLDKNSRSTASRIKASGSSKPAARV
jgi:hypothetical protein